MKITCIPDNYTGAYSDGVIFAVSEADPERITEVAVMGEGGEILGIKRFRGERDFKVNAAGYLSGRFAVRPHEYGAPAGFYRCAGRTLPVSIKADGESSPQRIVTAGSVASPAGILLSNSPSSLSVAADGCDELSVAAPGMRLSAEVTVTHRSQKDTVRIDGTECEDGIYSFFLNTAGILSYAGADYMSLTRTGRVRLTVGIYGDGRKLFEKRYAVSPPSHVSASVCWVNPYGCIDHCLFPRCTDETVRNEKTRAYTAEGYAVCGSQAETCVTAVYGYGPAATVRWLSEMLCSPRAWLIDAGEYVPIDIISNAAAVKSSDPVPFQAVFRPVRKTKLQRL